MSYFDEWIKDYFSKEDQERIRSIGCWSHGSTRKKGEEVVREELKQAGMADYDIEEFVGGAFPKPPKLSLQEMLEKINFKSLEVTRAGDGWVGTRYVLHTFNYGSSHPCETFEELKEWIEKNLRWQLN